MNSVQSRCPISRVFSPKPISNFSMSSAKGFQEERREGDYYFAHARSGLCKATPFRNVSGPGLTGTRTDNNAPRLFRGLHSQSLHREGAEGMWRWGGNKKLDVCLKFLGEFIAELDPETSFKKSGLKNGAERSQN